MTSVNKMNTLTAVEQKEAVAIAHFKAIRDEARLTIDRCDRAIRSLERKI